MFEREHTVRKSRIVCEVNASSKSRDVLEAAVSYCRERDVDLVVVWVVNPIELQPATGAGMPGTWGLVGVHATMVEQLRDEGVVVASSLRIGDPNSVLEEERERCGAEWIFTATDVPVRRCPACGALDDPRGVHFCPTQHRSDARAA